MSGVELAPSHPSLHVHDRKVDGLPAERVTIEIFTEGEWLACQWHPREPDSQADAGYLGTARTMASPIGIGFHAWEQNDSEFRYFCIPTNSQDRSRPAPAD